MPFSSKPTRSCLVQIQEDAVLVANTGQPFDRLSVVAICASHLGTKHDYQPTDPDPHRSDEGLIEAIAERELKTYEINPDRVTSDFRGEEETRLDYGGRTLWELLQNADDAMAPMGTPPADLIGAKGLGFKSVLELTERPEIHSGSFHFRFSSSATQEILCQHLDLSGFVPPLTFRIPHPAEIGSQLEHLCADYATVIKLPLRDGALGKVLSWAENLKPYFLLFFQYLENLKVVLPDGSWTIFDCPRDKKGELSDCEIKIEVRSSDSRRVSSSSYLRWAETWPSSESNKRLSVALCLPSSGVSEISVIDDHLPLFVFLPTEEKLPFHAIIHGSFDLQQARKHVRDPKRDLGQLGAGLRTILGRAICSMHPGTMLRALVPEQEPETDSLASHLWAIFNEELKQSNFISCVGGRKARPGKVLMWKYNLGKVVEPDATKVRASHFVLPCLMEDQKCVLALKMLGANEVQSIRYPHYLKFCKNQDVESCINALSALCDVIRECAPYSGYPIDNRPPFLRACREVPCWWIERGIARSLAAGLPLLRTPLKAGIPDWVHLDVIHSDIEAFLERLEKDLAGKLGSFWVEVLNGGLVESTDSELLEYVLLPTLEKVKGDLSWWSKHGFEAIELCRRWGPKADFDSTPPFSWDDKRRTRLSEVLFLPTDKGWLPGWKCYAGEAWGGPKTFDIQFPNIKDRGLLSPPDEWIHLIPETANVDVQGWKGILRFAGVSWEPKLIAPFRASDEKEELEFLLEDFEGAYRPVPPNPWKEGITREQWKAYCMDLKPGRFGRSGTQFDYHAKLREQWALDFFPRSLPEHALESLRIIKPLAEYITRKSSSQNSMIFTYEKGGGWSGRNVDKLISFALWQLRNYAWVACRPSLFYDGRTVAPSRGYMPGVGLYGLLPEVAVNLPAGQSGRELESFMVKILLVQEELPPSGDDQWSEWFNKLPGASQKLETEKERVRAARGLYRAAFRFMDPPVGIAESQKLPCLKWSAEGETETLAFVSAEEAYWLDESYLADPAARSEILKHGFAVFVLELQEGAKAVEWLGMEPLSKAVDLKPVYSGVQERETSIVRQRYEKRIEAMVVNNSWGKRIPSPEEIDILAVQDLRLEIIKRGESKIAEVDRVFWWQDDKILLIDVKKKWAGLGLALAYRVKHHEIASHLENLLHAKTDDEVLWRLRESGVPEGAINDLRSQLFAEGQGKTEIYPKVIAEKAGPVDTALPPDSTAVEVLGPSIAEDETVKVTVVDREKRPPVINAHDLIDDSRRQKGKQAEDWLRRELKGILPEAGWKVSDQPVKDREGRESDIVLSHALYGELHLEVKHVESGMIYWSSLQVEKAKANTGRYWITVLRPVAGRDGFEVSWIENPLEDLLQCRRSGTWLWQGRIDKQPVKDGEWRVPEPRPDMPARSFQFCVVIRDEYLNMVPTGLKYIRERLLTI